MKVAILTTSNQWFVPYAQQLSHEIKGSKLFFAHDDMEEGFDIVFILSYHRLIPKKHLKKHGKNIVIHASALPEGKGWAPMFWQVLEGVNEIPFTMFEAGRGVDDGDVYMLKKLSLTGYELNDELRKKQAKHITEMCLIFLNNYEKYAAPYQQEGKETFYGKRTWLDSKLDVNKSIKDQFNLLRIVNNVSYPAFFEIDGCKYTLKIEKVENEDK